jgi:hypothetical protein
MSSEDYECKRFALWLDAHGYMFSHLPLSTPVRGIDRFKTLARLKSLGVRPGVPDYLIMIGNEPHFIEMKKTSGGKVSPEQIQWLSRLDHRAELCTGADAAIAIVLRWTEESIRVTTKAHTPRTP